ncbi:MAG: hypothetical protein ACXVIY_10685 [Mucilaginibacter sp.]
MKILVAWLLFFSLPFCLKAQDTDPLGKSKEEVRKSYERSSEFTASVVQADDCDTVSMIADMKIVFFYKQDTCYLMKTIFPYNYVQGMRLSFNTMLKREKKDTWMDTIQGEEVTLTADKSKNQCIIQYRPVPKN